RQCRIWRYKGEPDGSGHGGANSTPVAWRRWPTGQHVALIGVVLLPATGGQAPALANGGGSGVIRRCLLRRPRRGAAARPLAYEPSERQIVVFGVERLG